MLYIIINKLDFKIVKLISFDGFGFDWVHVPDSDIICNPP